MFHVKQTAAVITSSGIQLGKNDLFGGVSALLELSARSVDVSSP